MFIGTGRSGNYGNLLGNQKYSPLENIVLARDDKAREDYLAVLGIRPKFYDWRQLFPRTLLLATRDWDGTRAREARQDQRSPLVVISSGRSQWIRNGLLAAKNRSNQLPPVLAFNASNLDFLVGDQEPSPPIYAPARNRTELRSVYILVHDEEYDDYVAALDDDSLYDPPDERVQVVSWRFQAGRVRTAPPPFQLVGFGASRFAAIELCRLLMPAQGWTSAWMLDDNIVGMSGPSGFPGWSSFENQLPANALCAGFRGASRIGSVAETREWAGKELKGGRGRQGVAVAPGEPGLIQQAGLYNIRLFINGPQGLVKYQDLNFSPVFITSAEDLSFSNLLRAEGMTYLSYPAIEIIKETATEDVPNTWIGDGIEVLSGAGRLQRARQELVRRVVDLERLGGGDDRPVPAVLVTPRDEKDGGPQTLFEFVDTRVLPNAGIHNAGEERKYRAVSHAMEQIMAKMIEVGAVLPVRARALFQLRKHVRVETIPG